MSFSSLLLCGDWGNTLTIINVWEVFSGTGLKVKHLQLFFQCKQWSIQKKKKKKECYNVSKHCLPGQVSPYSFP